MKIFLSIFFCFFILQGFAQKKTNELSLLAGRVSFGTGDILGPGIVVGYSRALKNNQVLRLGSDLIFETGVRQPVVNNPTPVQFLESFWSSTNFVFYPHIKFHPFKFKALSGLGLSIGPSLGYSWQTTEFRAERYYEPALQVYLRRSYLQYLNSYLLGYRISAGYSFDFTRQFNAGIRLDFSSHTNGDINTLLGLKAGYRF